MKPTGTRDRQHDDPVRRLMQQMVAATPVAAVAVGAGSIALGGSIPLVVWFVAIGIASAVPATRRFIPDARVEVIAGWYSVLAVSAAALALHPATFGMAGVVGALTIVGANVVRSDRLRWLILAAVIAFQSLGLFVVELSTSHVWVVLALMGIALATENMGALHRQIEAKSEQRLEALVNDRSTLLHLYEVASSIGASTTLHEALPDLLQSIADTVGVRTCAIAVYDADAKKLTLDGPVWMNGRPLSADGQVAVAIVDGGLGERALRSTRAVRFDRRTAGCMRPMFTDLGLESGLVCPVRLEGLVSGLVIVGDPIHGWFEPQHLDMLGEVARPAGLVMAQVARYEAAALLAEQMQEVADMKTDLVTMVTHELRTPLTSVIGSIDLLKRPEVSEDPTLSSELMTAADRQAHRLKRMIDDLLTVSRFDRGLVRPAPEPIVLNEAVERALWVVDGAPAVVEVPAGLKVLADRDHLQQILVNLVENAVKFAGDAPIQVGAGALDSGDVVLAVIDHGPGIDADDRHRVFDRFVQLRRGSRSGGGLGLSIVKMLSEGMGGRVEVFETPGGGATFAVRLPGVRVRKAWTAA